MKGVSKLCERLGTQKSVLGDSFGTKFCTNTVNIEKTKRKRQKHAIINSKVLMRF